LEIVADLIPIGEEGNKALVKKGKKRGAPHTPHLCLWLREDQDQGGSCERRGKKFREGKGVESRSTCSGADVLPLIMEPLTADPSAPYGGKKKNLKGGMGKEQKAGLPPCIKSYVCADL